MFNKFVSEEDQLSVVLNSQSFRQTVSDILAPWQEAAKRVFSETFQPELIDGE